MGLHLLSLCAGAQCGDHGLQGQDAPLIQVCNTVSFDYLGEGNLFHSLLRLQVVIFFFSLFFFKARGLAVVGFTR